MLWSIACTSIKYFILHVIFDYFLFAIYDAVDIINRAHILYPSFRHNLCYLYFFISKEKEEILYGIEDDLFICLVWIFVDLKIVRNKEKRVINWNFIP